VGEFTTLSSRIDITGGVIVGSDVTVGSGAVFVPRVKIGNFATIGAGSVVYRSVPAGATLYAAPAKTLRLNR
jgi:acetyltransferase-like isoleucine patch superfamily enzyme